MKEKTRKYGFEQLRGWLLDVSIDNDRADEKERFNEDDEDNVQRDLELENKQ